MQHVVDVDNLYAERDFARQKHTRGVIQPIEQLERAVEAAAGRAGAGEEWKAGMAGDVEATRVALRAGSEALGAECDVLVELVAAVQSQVLY